MSQSLVKLRLLNPFQRLKILPKVQILKSRLKHYSIQESRLITFQNLVLDNIQESSLFLKSYWKFPTVKIWELHIWATLDLQELQSTGGEKSTTCANNIFWTSEIVGYFRPFVAAYFHLGVTLATLNI